MLYPPDMISVMEASIFCRAESAESLIEIIEVATAAWLESASSKSGLIRIKRAEPIRSDLTFFSDALRTVGIRLPQPISRMTSLRFASLLNCAFCRRHHFKYLRRGGLPNRPHTKISKYVLVSIFVGVGG